MDANRILWISNTPPPRGMEAAEGWCVDHRQPASVLQLRSIDAAAVVLDLPADGSSASAIVPELNRIAPQAPVWIRHLQSDPPDLAALVQFIVSARATRNAARHSPPEEHPDWERLLIGESPEMIKVRHLIRMVGRRRATVLITGETGTGKEVAARALHLAGPRRRGPWVAVNCSALPENLLEAELFGHVRGAFTGAVQNRTGRFEQAQGGTLLLDEIGELPLDLQAKLLRVLQEREFQKLGSSETIRVDVRVVAATNCDLLRKIHEGRFREDLYYRLNVVPIHLPPLRARPGDIPLIAAHLLARICRMEEIPPKALNAEAALKLSGYAWPGNVRQLENILEMAVALGADHPFLSAADIALPLSSTTPDPAPGMLPAVALPAGGIDYEQTLAAIERNILQQALERTGGNKKAAAQMLRLKRTTLSAKVRNLSRDVLAPQAPTFTA